MRRLPLPGLLLLAFLPVTAAGQQVDAPVLRLPLAQAIELGLRQNPQVQAGRLSIALAGNALQKTRAKWLPSLEGAADFRYNIQLQSTVLPAGAFGNETPQVIRFGSKYGNQLGVTARQLLFDPTLGKDIKMEHKRVSREEQVFNLTQSTVKSAIAQAYYNALLHQQAVTIREKRLVRLDLYEQVTRAQVRLGVLGEEEAWQRQLEVKNAQIKQVEASQDWHLSLQKLLQAIGLPAGQQLELTDSLLADLPSDAWPADLKELLAEHPNVQQAQIDQQLEQLGWERARRQGQPTLAAYGNYSALYQSNNVNLFRSGAWTPFNYAGLQVSIPIFKANATHLEKQQYQLRKQRSEVDLARQRSDRYYALQEAWTQLKNAEMLLAYARENHQLGQRLFQRKQVQYTSGVLLYTQLLAGEDSLAEAEENLLKGFHQLLLAKVRWQQAKGD